MEYVLGIDQGATKTLAALADLQGNILSWGKAPGAYHSLIGLEYAIGQIRTAAEESMKGSGVQSDELLTIGAGITGVDFPSQYILLQKALQEEFRVPNTVVNDCIIALRAESMVPGSMIICAGTGLNIGLLTQDGILFTFGYYIDNRWQGGVSIGERTIQMITEAGLGMRPRTKLTDSVLKYFEEQTVDSLLEYVYMRDGKKNLKYLVPVVQKCAADGDEMAVSILKYFAEGCTRYALAGLRKYNMMHSPVTVYLSGGVFKNTQSLLNSMVMDTLQKEDSLLKVVNAKLEPVVGGVMMALEKAYGGEVPLEVGRRVQESAYAVGLSRN